MIRDSLQLIQITNKQEFFFTFNSENLRFLINVLGLIQKKT